METLLVLEVWRENRLTGLVRAEFLICNPYKSFCVYLELYIHNIQKLQNKM